MIIAPPPPHVQRVLTALRDPSSCSTLSLSAWDELIRTARKGKLLGVLAFRASASDAIRRYPADVQAMLAAALAAACFRERLIIYTADRICSRLAPLGVPVILLKGAAYIAQALPLTRGRMPADLDLLVPGEALDRVEAVLLAAGGVYGKTSAYDMHYYRAWAHELPPMRLPGFDVEIDVHHTILPVVARARPDAAALIRDAIVSGALPPCRSVSALRPRDDAAPLDETVTLSTGGEHRVLCHADQVLHCAAHLFFDSDCAERLADLIDFDALIRAFAPATEQFWPELCQRARRHGLDCPLWYTARFARAWLGTPIPERVLGDLQGSAPGRTLVCFLAARSIPVSHPDALYTSMPVTWARRLMNARAFWLRFPPHLLAFHVLAKGLRRV